MESNDLKHFCRTFTEYDIEIVLVSIYARATIEKLKTIQIYDNFLIIYRIK